MKNNLFKTLLFLGAINISYAANSWIDVGNIDPATQDLTEYRDKLNGVRTNASFLHGEQTGILNTLNNPTTGLVNKFSSLDSAVNNSTTGLTSRASQADLTDLNNKVTSNTTGIAGKASTADLSLLDGRVENAEGDITTLQSDKLDQAGVNAVINTAVASGSIFDAIGSAAEDGGAIATDIQTQVAMKSGSVFNSIVSGSQIAIDESLNSGSIAAALGDKADLTNFNNLESTVNNSGSGLATRASQADLTALQGTVDNNATGIAGKASTADLSLLDGRVENAEGDITTLQSDKLDQAGVNAVINTAVASGSIFDAIGSAAEDGGAIATDIQTQVAMQSGSVFNSIVSGSQIAITDSVASGSISAALDLKADLDTVTGLTEDVGQNTTDIATNTTDIAANTGNITTLQGTVSGKVDAGEFETVKATVNNPTGGVVNLDDRVTLLEGGTDTPLPRVLAYGSITNLGAITDAGSGNWTVDRIQAGWYRIVLNSGVIPTGFIVSLSTTVNLSGERTDGGDTGTRFFIANSAIYDSGGKDAFTMLVRRTNDRSLDVTDVPLNFVLTGFPISS